MYKSNVTNLQKQDNKAWYKKDYIQDGIPGISLNKWELDNKGKKNNNNLIVAVIDTQLDTNHEDLQGQLWTNPKEIPNNNVDDDKNGYIDDINGWNYLTTKGNNYTVWYNFEYVRIIREYKDKFENKKIEEIEKEDFKIFNEYQRAVAKYDAESKYYKNWLEALEYSVNLFPTVKDTLKYFFPKENYTYKQLDSLYLKYKINDKTFRQRRLDKDTDLGALIGFMKLRLDFDEGTIEKLIEKRDQLDSLYNKNLNINYNHRVYIGDNPNNLEKNYGSNKLNLTIKGIRKYNGHNTKVSGIIAANPDNSIGIRGFSKNIKIMPLVTSCSGDEEDKDIALAIRYAVDNGAKVINMSFYKEFSLHLDWVLEAIKYAEKNNVLVVGIAGNDSLDIDSNPKYPNDSDYQNPREVSDNFINVGSITNKVDSTMVSSFSNYGKQNVDLFAPGSDVYTTIPDNRYQTDSGTSLAAPMVSGTAALIWLYYPNLSVQEVKQIILNSGSEYDIEVLVPNGDGKKVPFKELSKSGKVLNVYNAMKMAKEMSLAKK
jgi:subtilisin family serine protease